MSLSERELQALWRQQSSADAGRAGCIGGDDWARLVSGEASAAERAQIAGHIASCSACAEEYRLLKPFGAWAEDAARELAGEAAPVGVRTQPGAWRLGRPSAMLLAAASVLIVLQAAGLYVLQQRRQGERTRLEAQVSQQQRELESTQRSLADAQAALRGPASPAGAPPVIAPPGGEPGGVTPPASAPAMPMLDVPIVDLDPAGEDASRGGDSSQAVTIPAGGQLATLILNFAPLPAPTPLQVDVADAAGSRRWSARVTRDKGTASLNVTLPRESHPPGTYVIRLADVTGPPKEIARYRVTLRYAGR